MCVSFLLARHFCFAKVVACGRVTEREGGTRQRSPPHSPLLLVYRIADNKAYGQITLPHLFIYELERDFCGLAEDQCGKGYLKEKNLIGTDVFNVSGSSGSFFMQNIWNHDLNLLYYVNYQFPIASEGYGSTADQILLWEGEVVSMSLYTDWSFYSDEAAGSHHLGTPTNMVQGPPSRPSPMKPWI